MKVIPLKEILVKGLKEMMVNPLKEILEKKD
ncbi:hypothetical protein c7_R324 [Megavirus courdo7]|uniref:Uncharacterized protein n=1 Tax=Megavirus courdo7 TaxID=1128135 RepID=H2EAG7_9VIRU|nr:hypothetical protein c7_R324 [Megavirus courdo7]